MLNASPNSYDVSEVTHTLMVSSGVDPTYYGTLTVSYAPYNKLLDTESLDAFVYRHGAGKPTSAQEMVRLVFNACLEALGNVPLQVQLEATTQGRSPITLTIINAMED